MLVVEFVDCLSVEVEELVQPELRAVDVFDEGSPLPSVESYAYCLL